MLFTFVAVWLIDKLGRKKLLLFGLTGMTIATFALGLGSLLPSLSGIVAWVTLGGMFLYSMWPRLRPASDPYYG